MIIVVGVAGSGKSTQSKLLATAQGWHWISMGKLLRSSLSGHLEQEMNSGRLLNDNEVEAILETELRNIAGTHKIILDGFPRRVAQTEWLLSTARAINEKVEAIVHLKAHEEVVLERLLHRGRPDDKPAAINERFLEYEKDIKPLLEVFANKGIPIIEVNGEQPAEVVYADIKKGLVKAGIDL